MSHFTGWIAGVLVIGIGGSAIAAEPSVEEFFRPAVEVESPSDPARLYPQGRVFPFGFYGLNTARDKPEGLTLIGPYGMEKNVETARKLGIPCTYTIGLPMDFLGKAPLKLTPDEIREQIREQVAKAAGSPEIAWWYLRPEELRSWRKNEMIYLEVASETIRKTDPLRRPVWMYEPNHRGAEALARTVVCQDICGKGMYTNYTGRRDSRIWVRWTIEQEIEAIRSTGTAAIPIAVPEMFQDPPDELRPLIPQWVRHDVYLSLVAGAKGIMVFSGWRRPKFTTFDAYYEAYAQCARELNGPLGLGQVFLFGERRNDVRVRMLAGPARLELMGKGEHSEDRLGEYPSVSFLDAAYRRDRYLLLVNSANEPVRVAIEGMPRERLRMEDLIGASDGMAVDGGRFELTLEPLGVRAFRIGLGE